MKYYTDGSTSPKNPGHGGCAFVVVGKEKVHVQSEFLGQPITNNYAETYAVLSVLCFANIYDPFPTIYTDSEYVINGLRRINNKKALLSSNLVLWEGIQREMKNQSLRRLPVIFVVSHSGVVENELADGLAYLATKGVEYNQFVLKEEFDEFCKTIKREKARERSGKQA